MYFIDSQLLMFNEGSLKDYCQKRHCLAVERPHAVGLCGIEDNAVAFVESENLTADGQFHTSAEHHIELLTRMRVLLQERIIGFGVHASR